MSDDAAQSERIKQLVELACIARGWSRQALAAHLGRDVSRLVPDGGNPKLDYVMKLADALEWPVGDVARAINGEQSPVVAPSMRGCKSFWEAKSRWRSEFDGGEYSMAAQAASEMTRLATSPDERAWALANHSAALQGLGHFNQAIELAARGLRESAIDPIRRMHLQTNISHCLLNLWNLPLSLSLAGLVVEQAAAYETNWRALRWKAYSQYVRGAAHLRLIRLEPDLRAKHLESARADLSQAEELIPRVALAMNDPAYAGLVERCRVGLAECDILIGRVAPADAVQAVEAKIAEYVSRDPRMTNFELEGYAWWALFGCSVAVDHLHGRAMQRAMAVFSEHALTLADRLSNWVIRERIVMYQFEENRRLNDELDIEVPLALDKNDRAMVASLMGRFPTVREVGWRMLDASRMSN